MACWQCYIGELMRKKNIEVMVQIIILLLIAYLLLQAILTKKINYYVHPRFYKGIWVSIIVFILFAINMKTKVREVRHNANIRQYLIFLVPLLAAFLFPASGELTTKDMNVSIGAANTLGETSSNSSANLLSTATEVVDATGTDESSMTETDQKVDVAEKYAQYEQDGIIVIDDNHFADWYTDLYADLDSFVGKKVEYLAQVYSVDDFEENQFLAGRYFMVCCAADMVGCGVICESDERSMLSDDEWVTVEGTIEAYDYEGESMPILTDTTITEAAAPEVEYIYYNYYN